MTLEELNNFRGSNPKPVDFDTYWSNAKSELNDLSLEYSIEEASFQTPNATCYNMFFKGVGNADIYVKYIKPKITKEKSSAVLLFHGYHASSDEWFNLLPFALCNFSVFAMDVRGQGGLSKDNLVVSGNTSNGHIIRGVEENNPNQLFYRNVFLDTAQLARIVLSMNDIDANNVFAMGYSQGGGLTLACASLETRIKAIAVGCPFLSDYKTTWSINALQSSAYGEIFSYFTHKDPLHEHENELFTKLGYIDVHHLASFIKAKTLFFVGLLDTACPKETVFAAYNSIEAPKEILIYPEFGHDVYPYSKDKALKFFLNNMN